MIAHRVDEGLPVRFIPLTGQVATNLLAADPALVRTTVDPTLYGLDGDAVDTLGVAAVLVCRDDLPDVTARAILGSIMSKGEQLADAHPVLSTLSPKVLSGLDPELYHPRGTKHAVRQLEGLFLDEFGRRCSPGSVR